MRLKSFQIVSIKFEKHRTWQALQARKACELCFEQCSGEGSLQCPNGHVVCRTCASAMVDSKLDEVGRSDTMLQSHREAGGRIPCVKNNPAIQPRCNAFYAEQALARSLPDETFLSYRAAQDQTIEDRIWNEQNRRFQEPKSILFFLDDLVGWGSGSSFHFHFSVQVFQANAHSSHPQMVLPDLWVLCFAPPHRRNKLRR